MALGNKRGNNGHSTASVDLMCYDIYYNFLGYYPSITMASEATGISKKRIIDNMAELTFSTDDFIWMKARSLDTVSVRNQFEMVTAARNFAYKVWMESAEDNARKKLDMGYELSLEEIKELLQRDIRTRQAFDIWCLSGLRYGLTMTISKYWDGGMFKLRLSVSKNLRLLGARFRSQQSNDVFQFVNMLKVRGEL